MRPIKRVPLEVPVGQCLLEMPDGFVQPRLVPSEDLILILGVAFSDVLSLQEAEPEVRVSHRPNPAVLSLVVCSST